MHSVAELLVALAEAHLRQAEDLDAMVRMLSDRLGLSEQLSELRARIAAKEPSPEADQEAREFALRDLQCSEHLNTIRAAIESLLIRRVGQRDQRVAMLEYAKALWSKCGQPDP